MSKVINPALTPLKNISCTNVSSKISLSRFNIKINEQLKIGVLNGWITFNSNLTKGTNLFQINKTNSEKNPYYFCLIRGSDLSIATIQLSSNANIFGTNSDISVGDYLVVGSFTFK